MKSLGVVRAVEEVDSWRIPYDTLEDPDRRRRMPTENAITWTRKKNPKIPCAHHREKGLQKWLISCNGSIAIPYSQV